MLSLFLALFFAILFSQKKTSCTVCSALDFFFFLVLARHVHTTFFRTIVRTSSLTNTFSIPLLLPKCVRHLTIFFFSYSFSFHFSTIWIRPQFSSNQNSTFEHFLICANSKKKKENHRSPIMDDSNSTRVNLWSRIAFMGQIYYYFGFRQLTVVIAFNMFLVVN